MRYYYHIYNFIYRHTDFTPPPPRGCAEVEYASGFCALEALVL